MEKWRESRKNIYVEGREKERRTDRHADTQKRNGAQIHFGISTDVGTHQNSGQRVGNKRARKDEKILKNSRTSFDLEI